MYVGISCEINTDGTTLHNVLKNRLQLEEEQMVEDVNVEKNGL